RAAGDPAVDLQAGALNAGAPEAPAGDEEAPGALQGGQEAAAGRDDEAVPEARDQPARLVPSARPPAPLLLRPLPDVEEGRGDQQSDQGSAELRQRLPVHPGSHEVCDQPYGGADRPAAPLP